MRRRKHPVSLTYLASSPSWATGTLVSKSFESLLTPRRQLLLPLDPRRAVLYVRFVFRVHLARPVPTGAERRQEKTSDAQGSQEKGFEATGDWSDLSRRLFDIRWIDFLLQDARAGVLGTEFHFEVSSFRARPLAPLTMRRRFMFLNLAGFVARSKYYAVWCIA